MKIHDITLTLQAGMMVWPGDPKVELGRIKKIEEGANANVSSIAMGVHTGTHVDAPYHFLSDGDTVENMLLEVLIGKVKVVRIDDHVDVITRDVLERIHLEDGIERVLFKTRNSRYLADYRVGFKEDFVGIDAGASELLVEKGIKLVGIDYLSIAPYKRSRPTHEVMLGAKMVIIEGVDLSDVEAGDYILYCLPLKLKKTEGAPARVILIEE
jgi:arylformamidase